MLADFAGFGVNCGDKLIFLDSHLFVRIKFSLVFIAISFSANQTSGGVS